jgi:CRISPR/Cas system-associated exonuclease Cas4 (RecB family)
MDRHTMDRHLNDSDVITASEIAQYAYCPFSWYLERCGCQPQSPVLANGIKRHSEVGEKISLVTRKERDSRQLCWLGYLALAAASFCLLWWLR